MPTNPLDYYNRTSWYPNAALSITNGIAIPVIPELVAQIGLNDALLLTQIDFWVNTLDTNVEVIEGIRWLHLSAQEMIDLGFVHVSRQKINKTIDRLIKRGLLEVRYQPGSRDRGLKIDYDKVEALGVSVIELNKEE